MEYNAPMERELRETKKRLEAIEKPSLFRCLLNWMGKGEAVVYRIGPEIPPKANWLRKSWSFVVAAAIVVPFFRTCVVEVDNSEFAPEQYRIRNFYKLYEERTLVECVLGKRGRYAWIVVDDLVEQCGPLKAGHPHGDWKVWFKNYHWTQRLRFGHYKVGYVWQPWPIIPMSELMPSKKLVGVPQKSVEDLAGGWRLPQLWLDLLYDEKIQTEYAGGVRNRDDGAVRVASR